jgi:uncharacterized membrane protein (DUF373 family)
MWQIDLRSDRMEIRMNAFAAIKSKIGIYELYTRFELVVSAVLLVFVSIIIVYSIVILGTTLVGEFIGGFRGFEITALKDTFGLILTVLILVEFNHSIALAIRRRVGVLQARVIVVIAIIVIARKLILLDYATTDLPTLLALAGLALALGALYWLLSEIERRRRAAGLPEE